MGPDEASYQGKKRNEKSWARYREAMAKKASAPKQPASGNTVDSAGRESFVKPGHEGWRIDTGAPSRADGAPKAKAPTPPKQVTYGLGKHGISTVIDLGHKPSKEEIAAAHKRLRGGKPPKIVNTPAIKKPTAPQATAPNPERPPYVYKQDNKVEFKPINVGENAVRHERFYGKNRPPLLPEVKAPSGTNKRDIALQVGGVAAAIGTIAALTRSLAKPSKPDAAPKVKIPSDAAKEIAESNAARTRNKSPQVTAAVTRPPLETKVEAPKTYPRPPRNTGHQNVKSAIEAVERADARAAEKARFQPPAAPKVETPAPAAPKKAPTINTTGMNERQIEQLEIAASRAAIGAPKKAPTVAPQPTVKAPETPAAPKQKAPAPATPSTPEQEIAVAQAARKGAPAAPAEPGVVSRTITAARNIRKRKTPEQRKAESKVVVPKAENVEPKIEVPTPPAAPRVSKDVEVSAQTRINEAAVKLAKAKQSSVADKFGATEAEVEAVATSGEATKPPTKEQVRANAEKLKTAPQDVQDLAKQIEAARAENIALGGTEAKKKKGTMSRFPKRPKVETPAAPATGPKVVTSPTVPTPSGEQRLGERRGGYNDAGTRRDQSTRLTAKGAEKAGLTEGRAVGNKVTSRRKKGAERRITNTGRSVTPTLEEVASMQPAEREALITAAETKATEIENKLFEATNVGETAKTGEKVVVDVAKGIENHNKNMERRIRRIRTAYKQEKSQRVNARRAGLDPETLLPTTGREVRSEGRHTWVGPNKGRNIALSSTSVEPTTVYETVAEKIGQLRGEKAIEQAAVEAAAGKNVVEAPVPTIKTTTPATVREEIAEKAVKYEAPEPVDVNEREHQRLQERLHGDAPTKEELARQIKAGEGPRPVNPMTRKMGEAAASAVLEGGIDPVSSGEGPETERAARHAEAQTAIEEAQKRVDKLEKKLTQEEEKTTKTKARVQKTPEQRKAESKVVGRGERTAESFQPGGATFAEQLLAPENADVKRIVRVNMEGGGMWDEKPAEFKVEQIVGKDLEDMKERALKDRREYERRQAEIIKARELRSGTDRREIPRREVDLAGLDPADRYLLEKGTPEDIKLVQQTGVIEGDKVLEQDAAEIENKRNALRELQRVAEEARVEAAKTGGKSSDRVKTRAEIIEAVEARRKAPWFEGDLPSPRQGTGLGMFEAPTIAEMLEEAKLSNRLRTRLQGSMQGMPVERRTSTKRGVPEPYTGPEKRVEAMGPQRPPGQQKVPDLTTPEMKRLLNAPGTREPRTTERRRPTQFENPPWPREGNLTEAETEKIDKSKWDRFTERLGFGGPKKPAVTSPSVRGSEAKTPAKPSTTGKLVRGGVKAGGIATAAFAALGAAEAGAKSLGKGPIEAAKSAGTTFFKDIPEVAKGLAVFTGIDLLTTKAIPTAAGKIATKLGASATKAALTKVATAGIAKAGLAGFIGAHAVPYAIEQSKELATQIGEGHLARTEAALEKKGSEAKYGTVEAATATRKRQERYRAALKRNESKKG